MRRALLIAWILALISGWASATDYSALASCKVYLPMENATGNETGSPGGTFTASASAPTQSATHKFGTYAKAFASASSQYFSQADGGATDIYGADQPLTICLWWKPASIGSQSFVSKWAWPGTDYHDQYYLISSGSGIVQFGLCPGTNATAVEARSNTHLSGTNWIHIAAVYNDTDARIYINGVLDSNSTGPVNPLTYSAGIGATTDTFYMGCLSWTGSPAGYLNGTMDEFGMWNAALTSTQISDICTNGVVGSAPASTSVPAIISMWNQIN
jgi:hypothetical protein